MQGWILLILFLIFSPGSLFAAGEKLELDLEKLSELIKSKNQKVLAAQLETEAAALRSKNHLKWSFFPDLKLNFGTGVFSKDEISSNEQMFYGLEVNVNLYNKGQDALEQEIGKLTTEEMRLTEDEVLSAQIVKARHLFWQILFLREKRQVLTEGLEKNKANLSQAIKRIKNGIASQTDRLEFELNEMEISQLVNETTVSLTNLEYDLNSILGIEKKELSFPKGFKQIEIAFLSSDDSPLIKEFYYKGAQIHSQILKKKEILNSRSFWPRLDLFAEFKKGQEAKNEVDRLGNQTWDESVVGIKLSFGFTEGLSSVREVNALAKELLAASHKASVIKGELEITIKKQQSKLNGLLSEINNHKRSIELLEQYYRQTEAEYKRGVKNSPDMLGAGEKLMRKKLEHLEALLEFHQTKEELQSFIKTSI